MARRPRYRKRRGRRPMRRRRRRRRGIPKSLFGNSRAVVLKYADAGQFTQIAGPGSVNWTVKSFSCVNPKFPDFGNPTLHPAGWIELRPLYKRALVIGSKITLTTLAGTNTHPSIQYIDKQVDNFDGLNSQLVRRVLNNRNVKYGWTCQARGGQSRARITMGFSPKKFFHKKDLRDNAELSCDTSATAPGPEQECWFNVGMSTTHITANALSPVDYVVELSYYVLFSDPTNALEA